jgi:hexulose-6-phosphate isomerase
LKAVVFSTLVNELSGAVMKFGITQYAASGDGKNFIEAAARFGMAGAEPYFGDVQGEFLASSEEDLRSFRAKADRAGVEIPSTCLAVFNGDSSAIREDGFDQACAIVRTGMKATAALGAKTMLLCTFVESHPDTREKRKNLLRVVRAMEPTARDLKLRLALETPLAAEDLAELVDAAESEIVGVYYDYGNALAMGYDPAREIPILGDRIMAIHAKDSARLKLGGLHFGEGDVNLPAAVKATKSIGYDGWMIVETPGDDPAKMQRDIALLRSLF